MFNIVDHVSGAGLVRIKRKIFSMIGKPDASCINDLMYVGGVCDVGILAKQGFSSILDMREENQIDSEEISKHSINYLNIPVTDRQIPTLAQVNQAITWLENNLQHDKKVFLHCNLGRGRGPLIACLYLISKGIVPQEAVKIMKNSRPYTYFNKKQLRFLEDFSKLRK